MKPRRVVVTLEIDECQEPLDYLRDVKRWRQFMFGGNVLQVQANVIRATKPKKRRARK